MKKVSTTRHRSTPGGHLPKSWDQKRAREVATYYDNQSDEDAIAEAEAAYTSISISMLPIPVKLVPAVQALIKRRAG